jgi:membrane protease YdiL (CAAX protease family)
MAGVGLYLALAFGIAWAIWLLLLVKGWQPGGAELSWAITLGACAPALAGLAARMACEGKSFEDAGLGLNMARAWPYYLVALLFPMGCAVVALGLVQALGLATVDWTLATGLAALPAAEGQAALAQVGSPWVLWVISPLNAVLATPILLGEEFGWRGYLQQRILTGSPLGAAVVTGVIWSAWHLPVNLAGYNFPQHPVAGMAVFTLGCVLASIILGWLMRASGSVWVASLGHASMNAVGGSLVFLATARQDPVVHFLGLAGLVPLGVFAGWIVATGRLNASQGEGA